MTGVTGQATAVKRHWESSGVEEQELFLHWRREQDRAAREALLERYMPLARRLARRYLRSSEPLDDLQQVAALGLLKAIDRFDVERGHSFSSFAVPTVLGEIRRYFRDCGWTVHVPRRAQERALRVRDAQQRLTNERAQAPTVSQLAEYLELDHEDVVDALQAIRAYSATSLDSPRPAEGEAEAASYQDTVGEVDERFELVELDTSVAAAIRELAPRERRVLQLRFVQELTQQEIARRVGVSQMQVSRLLRRTLERLRLLVR